MDVVNLRSAPGVCSAEHGLQRARSCPQRPSPKGWPKAGGPSWAPNSASGPLLAWPGAPLTPISPAPQNPAAPPAGGLLTGMTPVETLMPGGWQTARSLQGLQPGCGCPVLLLLPRRPQLPAPYPTAPGRGSSVLLTRGDRGLCTC